jgi:hypothetical protein
VLLSECFGKKDKALKKLAKRYKKDFKLLMSGVPPEELDVPGGDDVKAPGDADVGEDSEGSSEEDEGEDEGEDEDLSGLSVGEKMRRMQLKKNAEIKQQKREKAELEAKADDELTEAQLHERNEMRKLEALADKDPEESGGDEVKGDEGEEEE